LFYFLAFINQFQVKLRSLHNYETSIDEKTGSKVLKGLLTRADIESDASFKWFKENMKTWPG
jgi:hypothetical protein